MGERILVFRILRGNKAAGEKFVLEYYPAIFRLLRHLTGSADAGEDLTQQTFLKAWQALPAFRHEASLRTWLHRIAYFEYTHWLRAKRDHAPLEAIQDLPASPMESEWEMVVLPEALARLSEEHREAFLLYHLQELSVKEIAAVVEAPVGTVKSRLFAARRRLRELLSDAAEPEETPEPDAPTYFAPMEAKEGIPHEMQATAIQRKTR